MLLQLNDYVQKDIDKIQQWFNDAFGFIPSKKQVVMFAAESIREVIAEIIIKKRINYKGIGTMAINIPESLANKLKEYVMETGELFYSVSFLVECLILFRSLALPEIKKKGLVINELKKLKPEVFNGHIYEAILNKE